MLKHNALVLTLLQKIKVVIRNILTVVFAAGLNVAIFFSIG